MPGANETGGPMGLLILATSQAYAVGGTTAKALTFAASDWDQDVEEEVATSPLLDESCKSVSGLLCDV